MNHVKRWIMRRVTVLQNRLYRRWLSWSGRWWLSAGCDTPLLRTRCSPGHVCTPPVRHPLCRTRSYCTLWTPTKQNFIKYGYHVTPVSFQYSWLSSNKAKHIDYCRFPILREYRILRSCCFVSKGRNMKLQMGNFYPNLL